MKIVLVILSFILAFCIGGALAYELKPPEYLTEYIDRPQVQIDTANNTKEIWQEPEYITLYKTETEYIYVEPKIIYVTVNNTVEKTVEKTIYSDMNYIPWESKQEVQGWIDDNWDTAWGVYYDKFGNNEVNPKVDCTKMAIILSELAARDNRWIGLLAEYPIGAPEWHNVDFAYFWVGNYCYRIEPQTGEIKGIWGTLD